jgi:cell division protein FtsZ
MNTEDLQHIDSETDKLLDFAFTHYSPSIIKVIGIGGGGGNAVNHMYELGVEDVEFVVCNTDSQALANSPVRTKIQLGTNTTEGRGAGSDPVVGEKAAVENLGDVINILENNTKMVFITAGMGGGTGTGAAPIIAREAKSRDILTVAIVTIPFQTEVGNRFRQAIAGIEKLQENVDALIVIDNENINKNYGDFTFSLAFKEADKVLATAAKAIVQIIKIHGMWNVDFNDVRTIMKNSGVALMGIGTAKGEKRAAEAVENALKSPLLNNNDIRDSKNILLNIISGNDEILMKEVQQICREVQKVSGKKQDQFIMGVARDLSLGDEINVTVIATGFKSINLKDIDRPDEEEDKKVMTGNGSQQEQKTVEQDDNIEIPQIPESNNRKKEKIPGKKNKKKKTDENAVTDEKKGPIQTMLGFLEDVFNDKELK